MNGLCAPSNQGNTQDGVWLEWKEVKRLRKIAVEFEQQIRRALIRGVIIGVTVAFLLTAALNSTVHAVELEEIFIELTVVPVGERCYAPYAPDLIKEFENNNVGITVTWYDNVDELREAMIDKFGMVWDDRDIQAASNCEHKPEFNISYCDIYAVRPTMVDDDTTTSIGHEVLHGLLGAYHD